MAEYFVIRNKSTGLYYSFESVPWRATVRLADRFKTRELARAARKSIWTAAERKDLVDLVVVRVRANVAASTIAALRRTFGVPPEQSIVDYATSVVDERKRLEGDCRALKTQLDLVSGALCDVGDVNVEPYHEGIRALTQQRNSYRVQLVQIGELLVRAGVTSASAGAAPGTLLTVRDRVAILAERVRALETDAERAAPERALSKCATCSGTGSAHSGGGSLLPCAACGGHGMRSSEEPATPNSCDHGVAFDEEAKGLAPADVRARWPRLVGPCPKGCGFSGIAYASKAHFVCGDW